MSTPFYQMEPPKKEHASLKKAGKKGGQPSAQEAGVTPSGPRGDNPGTAGPGKTEVVSKTPENATGHINPSSPEDANVTPGSIGQK